MISVEEYKMLRKLEELFALRFREIFKYQTQIFTLKDGQRIRVNDTNTSVKLYEYFLSPFGVVRVLCERPVKFDKTPMCLELDEILFAELSHAAGL